MSAASLVTPRANGKTRDALPLEWLVAIVAASYWTIDLVLLRGGTPAPLDDSWEIAVAARELLLGHGFRTPMIHPPLWTLHDAANRVPLLVHGPLLPLAMAPFVRLLGSAAIDAAAWLAAACWVGAAIFTARVTSRAYGRGAAVFAAFIVTASPIALRMTHHDMALAAGAMFFGLGLDLVARPHPHSFAVGFVLGLGALVRPEFLLALPIAWAALGMRSGPGLLLGYALPVAPWAVHAFNATGSPAFNLSSYLVIGFTRAHPGFSPMSDFGLPPAQFGHALGQALPSLPAKWAHMAPRAIRHLLASPSASLGWLAAAGAWSALRSPATRHRATLALLVAAIPFVVVTTTESSQRYVAEFLPLWALGVAGGLEALRAGVTPRLPASALRTLAAVVLLVSTLPALMSEAQDAAHLRAWIADERADLVTRSAYASASPTSAATVAGASQPSPLMYSDTPDFVAWTTARPTLYIDRDAYLALPAPGTIALDRPSRGEPADEWFHLDLRANPGTTRGGPAGGSSAP